MFMVLTLLGGLTFLALGASSLVRGTVGLTQLAGLPPFLIGLVVIAFGTSTPQLFTAFQATWSGGVDMAIATAVGASIFNIFATLGFVALSGGAVHLNKRLWVRGSVALMVIAIITATAVVTIGKYGLPMPRWAGVVAMMLMFTYVAAAYVYDHKNPTPLPMLKETRKLHPAILAGLFAGGLFGLVLGANLMVDAATRLSTTHGLNPRFLGLTVLAIGTAIPQLLATYRSYRHQHLHPMLLGNLIGNTIFNLLGVCGLLVILNPVTPQPGLLLNSFVVLGAATVAFTIFTHPAMRRFKRAEAVLFLLAYALFLFWCLHHMHG